MNSIEKLRDELKRFMDNNPDSMRFYAQEMKMSQVALQDFLENKRESMPMTIGRIIKFMRDKRKGY